jgi:hypothetical protein
LSKEKVGLPQELVRFDAAPVDNVEMEFEIATSYQQQATSSKKRKQVALKAIIRNCNDPAIEKSNPSSNHHVAPLHRSARSCQEVGN